MKNKIKKNIHSYVATLLGLLTSTATAMVVIDFEAFDFKKPNDLMKLFVITMPAIGGYVLQIKKQDENGNQAN